MPEAAKIALTTSTRVHAGAKDLPTTRGFILAMEDIAARADLPAPLGWELFDDEGDPAVTASLAEQIVDDPTFIAAVGPMGSTEALANAPIFADAGLLHVSPCGSHPSLCRLGYRTFHRLVPNEETQGREIARLTRSLVGADSLAIVHDHDAFGTTLADNVETAFRTMGGDIEARVGFDQGRDAYDDVAARIAAGSSDAVVFAVHGHEGLLISRALRAAGVDVPFVGSDGLKTNFFLGGGGGEHGEAYHTHAGADFRRLPSAADFARRYVERWPLDSTYSPEAYDAAMLVAEAFATAGVVDRAAVLDAFDGIDRHDGVTGEVRFDETGERIDAPVSYYRVTRDADGTPDMTYQGVTTDLA